MNVPLMSDYGIHDGLNLACTTRESRYGRDEKGDDVLLNLSESSSC